jgi:hypothetical protein
VLILVVNNQNARVNLYDIFVYLLLTKALENKFKNMPQHTVCAIFMF